MATEEPPSGVAKSPDRTSAGEDPGALVDELRAPTPRLPKRNIAAIWIQGFGIGFATLMPVLVALPVYVAQISPDNKSWALGAALGAQALLSFVFAPFFGELSDRTTSRWGMRRPGLAIGSLGVALGLVTMGLAHSLSVLFLGVVILGVSTAVANASDKALIPDSVPDRARGMVFGVSSLITVAAGMLASIVGPMFLGNQLMVFGGSGVVLVASILIALPLLRDRVLDRRSKPREPLLRVAFEGYRFNPKDAPDFSWVFASYFLITLGISFTTSFAVYFLTDHLSVSDEQLPSLVSLNGSLSLGGTAIGTLVGAIVADRMRSRKTLVLVAGVLIATGSVIVAFAPSVPLFFLGTAVITFSIGLFIPIGGKLMMTVLPGGYQHVGKFMSIITIADQLPRSLGPYLAPAVIALGALTPLGGYPILYLVAGIAAIIGGLLVRRVRGVR